MPVLVAVDVVVVVVVVVLVFGNLCSSDSVCVMLILFYRSVGPWPSSAIVIVLLVILVVLLVVLLVWSSPISSPNGME